MPKRYIILQPIGNNKGNGVVTLEESVVTVSLSDTKEEYSLYFICSMPGGEYSEIDAGTVRGGYAKSFSMKAEDVKKIDTVVLLQGREPYIYGSLTKKSTEIPFIKKTGGEKEKNKSILGINDGFTWAKVSDGRFAENYPIIRHIFENINVLYKINSLGYYYYGTKGAKAAVAIPAKEGEKNPFSHISDCARYIGGYWTVGADKKEKYFYSLID